MSEDPTVFDAGHGPLSSEDELVATGAGGLAALAAYRLTDSEVLAAAAGGATYKFIEGTVDQ